MFQYLPKKNFEIGRANSEGPHLGKAVFAFEVVNGVFADLVSRQNGLEGNLQMDGEARVF